MGVHKFGSIQLGIVFVCVKISELSIFYNFQSETKSQIHFNCTFQIIKKNDQVSRSRLFRWEFYCVIEHFVSRPFTFGIHQEMLTRTQLFLQPVILNVSHYVFHIHISCSGSNLHAVLSVSMLKWSVQARKLLITKSTLEGDISLSCAVLLSNMVIQIIVWFCEETGTLGTIKCTSRTTLIVTRKIKLCNLGTTILTFNSLVSIYKKHLNKKCWTDWFQMNVKTEATWR